MLSTYKKKADLSMLKKSFNLMNSLEVLKEATREISKTLAGFLLLVLLFPIAAPTVIFFFVISKLVRHLCHLRFGENISVAAGLDAVWGYEPEVSRPFITVGITMRGNASVEKIRKTFQERILDAKDKSGNRKHRKLLQFLSIELGYYIWKDAIDFNIDNHIRVWKDPQDDPTSFKHRVEVEESATGAEEVIGRYLDKYGADPLPVNRPQWEIVILESKSVPKEKYGAVLRLHHSIGDGVSLVRLILGSLVDNPIMIPSVGAPAIHPALRLLTALRVLFLLPIALWQTTSPKDANPFHGPKLTGQKRYLLSKGIKLQTLKDIKKGSGATINDILMSCLSAALARSFDQMHHFHTPFINALVPVNYHDLTQELDLKNSFLLAIFKLPTPHEAITPHDRLRLVKEQCDKAKKDCGMLSVFEFVRLMCSILPAKIVDPFVFSKGKTLGVSNVPGPQQQLMLFGDTLDGIGFWLPHRSPCGVAIGIISYDGWVRVSFVLDTAFIANKKDMEFIMTEFEEEVKNLQKAYVNMKKSN